MYRFMKRCFMLGLMGSLLAIGLTATVAMAAHLPTPPFDFPGAFGVNPGVIGQPQGSFTASYAQFGYQATVDQTATGPGTATFTEHGFGSYTAYNHPDLFTTLTAPTTGLNSTYAMYVEFTATGSTSVNMAGALDGVFTSFTIDIYIDPLFNTTAVFPAIDAPDGSLTINNRGDDIHVATSMGNGLVAPFGGFHISPGFSFGNFDVVVEVKKVGNYFTWPYDLDFAYMDFNGGFSTLSSNISAGSFTDGRVSGNGNMTPAVIPEPGTLLLLGTGLAAVGFLRFRRKDA